jgi:hypothetical protein
MHAPRALGCQRRGMAFLGFPGFLIARFFSQGELYIFFNQQDSVSESILGSPENIFCFSV